MHAPGRLVLLGHPVAHSLSPAIHNAALADAGLAVRYEALDVDPRELSVTVERLKGERTAGNVTVPHKERMFDACDALTDLARRVGAVNTFWIDDAGRLVGDNTDVGGFTAAAESLLGDRPRDISVGVYGAGGAAAAVLAAVETWPGCTARVYNRTPERARILSERFGSVAQPVDDIGAMSGSHLVVNATSVGLKDGALPIDVALIGRDSVVLDLVYRPGETQFVHALRARGIRAADGISMLVEQAALAFEAWFGITANRAVMWNALGGRSVHS